jgi:NAD(P)-dependent dehydrogenase (short-subunit alcohol dehydrogenase family)/pimeloyl-ACP methyl ester carboxylesterase
LLVHGYPDTHRVWDAVSAALAVDHHVVSYDVRGAGLSGAPREVRDYRLDQLADDLFAVTAAISPDRPVHVAGHDWGSVQAWHAATDPRAAGRIASFTTISGPCLDHAGHWYRRRLTRPTPRHLAQLAGQSARSWYITVFQLPLVAPLAWRHGLARRWAGVLERGEGVTPRPGLVSSTLAEDAVRGLNLYRANMRPRMRHPAQRIARVPVQVITVTRDRYLSPAMVAEDLHRWAPRLTRRTIDATHWSALTEKGPIVAGMIRSFAAGSGAVESMKAAAGSAAVVEPAMAAGAGKSFAGRLAVITGGGSGIGRATALAFADRGARVVVCDVDLEAAQRTAELAGLLGPAGYAYLVDVSDGPAMDAFAAKVSDTHGVPDILVNNAGIGHAGTVLATTDKEWQRVLDVNLWGVIHGCRAFGARMADSGAGGHIVNVASAAAYLPSKDLAAYATSKAAVVALSNCLRGELAHSGVGVSVICPGFVKTNITRTTTFSGLSELGEADRRDRATRLYARRNYPPEKVAEQIADAVLHKRAMVPVTPEARAGWLIARFAPGLARAAARRGLALPELGFRGTRGPVSPGFQQLMG